jgi:hypothetical protein
MTSMSLRTGSNQNIRDQQGGAFARNQNFMQQFKGGGQSVSLKEQAGLIQGPGTGKSDSIEANLPVKGFVLPVEVVQAIGPDKLQAMIDQFRDDSPTMDSEEVPAKVSNGEFFVPPEVVAKTGHEYWDSLVQQVTGSPAQPEISQEGVKAAGGYGPNLSDERQAAQQFWSQPNRAVVPTPGRANPANPSDVMRDRMQTSAVNSQTQAQGLRSQISQNLANPVQATTPVQAPIQPTVQPVSLKAQAQAAPAVNTARQPAVSYFNAPKPPTLKDQLLGVGNDIALATSLASDVLQAPHIAKNRDEAISGLKARAGFSPTATPFQYAEGGYVDPEEERRKNPQSLKAFAQPPSVNSPQRNLYEGGQELARTGVVGFVNKGQQAIQDVNQKYDPVISNAVGGVVDKVLYGTEGGPQTPNQVQPTGLKAAVFNPEQDQPKVTQTNTPATTSLKEAVAQSEGVRNITGKPVQQLDDQGFYTVTGENGATAKVLDWNTTQNSLQQTMGADDYNRLQAQNQDYQNQRNAAVIGGSNSYEKGEKGTYRASSSTDGFTPNSGLNLGSSAERTENAPKYNMKDGIIYQESGSSADEFNAKIPKTTNGVDPRAAQLINIIETGDADAQKEGRSLLAKHFPDIFTKYTIGLK